MRTAGGGESPYGRAALRYNAEAEPFREPEWDVVPK
jgi:hypothetical protein